MRKFALENSLGEVMEFNDDSQFFHSPDGLGYGSDSISGTITFADNKQMSAYARYTRFARFAQHTPLILYYEADAVYKISVEPEEIEKTELGDLGLSVDVDFTRLSKFYREYSDGDLTDTEATVRSDSVTESGVELRIQLPDDATEIDWEQTLDGSSLLTGRLVHALEAGDVVTVSTITSPYSITLTRDGTTTDVYGSSDFSTDRFPLLQYGANGFTATALVGDVETDCCIAVKGRLEYETV